MLSKRNMVLCDLNEKSNKRAVLALSKNGDEVEGTLRLYNFPLQIDGILTLGFYADNEVLKSGLSYKSPSFYAFKLSKNILDKRFSCAVLNVVDANVRPILYGTSEGRDEEIYANIVENLSADFSYKNAQKVLDENGVDYEKDEKQEIEAEIDKCLGDCKNCFYKENFYNASSDNEPKDGYGNNEIENVEDKEEINPKNEEFASFVNDIDDKIERGEEERFDDLSELKNIENIKNHKNSEKIAENTEKNDKKSDFYEKIANNENICEENEGEECGGTLYRMQGNVKGLKEENDEDDENVSENYESFVSKLQPQIDKLFEKNPAETVLEEIFPSSKWVRVEYEDDGDFYVFGLIYEGEKVKYVCYGVPAVYEENPPKELTGFPIFLPLNAENKKGFGYWLTYQDAETGNPIKAVVD